MEKNQRLNRTKKLVIYGLMGAISYLLMMLHLPFKYLGFLELEFSDIPAIVVGFTYGPFGAVVVEVIKNCIKVMVSSTTGGVGELANLAVSIGYVVPSAIMFRKIKKNKILRNSISSLTGTISMCSVGILINYFVTVPLYVKLFFGGKVEGIIGLTSATVPAIDSLVKVILLGITPFNIVKCIIISIVGILVYESTKFIVKSLEHDIME